MILQEYRALARLPRFGSQCLDTRVAASLAFNLARVSSLGRSFTGSELTSTLILTVDTSTRHRAYATNAVSRPKAHTGRITSAPRKKVAATASEATTSGPAKAGKKPVAKKAKSKSKSKPRTKAKSTKARKKSKKAKAAPAKKKRKAQTPEQKSRLAIKELKVKALTPPKKLPYTAFTVLLAEKTKEERRPVGKGGESVTKECSTKYRSFTPEEREHYNHIANQNKAANAAQYREWITSHTPSQIHEANNARILLRRRTKGTLWPKLQDERLVTRLKNSYNLFYTQRYRSGDFAGMKVTEAAKLIGSEWRGLSADEKQPYSQMAEEDSARYDQEVKAVYNRDVQHKAAKAA
ncbi:MAG: hypothetical protein Q9201_007676 [Fulgogasparrea decipioides]